MALYLGSKKVSPTKTITKEVSSMKPFFDAGGKCSLSNATSFEGIIQYSDTSNVTDMSSMFSECGSLTTIPQFDTSNVINMNSMFYKCELLTSIPLLDTSIVTNMDYMFYNCYNIKAIPLFNISNVLSMGRVFYGCMKLTTIPRLDTSKVNDFTYAFFDCGRLEAIHMINMKVNFDIKSSTKFTREALVEIINNCYDLTTLNKTARLTMGSTNLAKLTEEDKLIATNKGWTLA